MDELTNIKALLDRIHVSEGTEFGYDKEAILNEYKIQAENRSSLAIKVLSIFGGFLATLAFIGFLALAGLYDSEFGLLMFGIGFIASAIWLNKEYDKLIIDTFSISIYVIGFAMLAFGLLEMHTNENIVMLIIALISLISLFITQNYILSFISVLTISGSLLTLIIYNNSYNLIHLYNTVYTLALTYFFLNEAKLISSNKKLSKLYNPIKIGLVISLLFGLIIIGKRHFILITENYIWLSSIIMIVVIIYIVNTIIKINNIKTPKNKTLIYALTSLTLIPTVFAPSISGAVIIILLSFLVNYKTGLAIGIISIIYFISQYYYDLNFTLLTKSILLFVSGIICIVCYVLTTKNLKSNEKI